MKQSTSRSLHFSTSPYSNDFAQPGSWSQVDSNWEELADKIMDRLYGKHAGKAVVACQHCGQWGARYCSCRNCGAPID